MGLNRILRLESGDKGEKSMSDLDVVREIERELNVKLEKADKIEWNSSRITSYNVCYTKLLRMGCIICIIMALVQQRDNRMPESLKILTWASGGYILISKIIGSAISVATALSHPQTIYNQWEFLRAASEMDITGNRNNFV